MIISEPLDVKDNFWNEGFPMGTLIPEPPTPEYKPEEEEEKNQILVFS